MTEIVNGLLFREGQVLMARRAPSRRIYPGAWSFPGGHVENGETLEQALRRELIEEIGVRSQSQHFMGCVEEASSEADRIVRYHFFMVDGWEGQPANLGDEHSEIRWMNVEDAKRLPGLALQDYSDLFDELSRR